MRRSVPPVSGCDRELARTLDASARLKELEERREALLRTFGTGLRLGLYWFPPHLRRGVYELMSLNVFLYPDGGYAIEVALDGVAWSATRKR